MKLAICIPSNRGFEQSIESIDSALKYALNKNIKVSISDNSESLEKYNYWKNINSSKLIYSSSDNLGPNQNWLTSLTQVDADFKSILSDDDLIESTDVNCSIQDFLDPEIIGIRPTMSLSADSIGIYNTTSYSITDNTAIDRVTTFLKLN